MMVKEISEILTRLYSSYYRQGGTRSPVVYFAPLPDCSYSGRYQMKRTKNILFVLFFALLGASGSALAEEASAEIPWITGTNEALKESRRSGKPVVVDLWAVWCVPCKLMEKTTFRDSRVLEAMEGFVPLKVDADSDTVFVERYNIEIFPTMLFLDEKGGEIARLIGLVEADPLLEKLEVVGKGYGSYVEQAANRTDPQALKGAATYMLEVGNSDEAVTLLRKASKLAKGAEAVELEELELMFAETLLSCGRTGAAAKELERLAESATCAASRGRALVGLVRAERERRREEQAEQALTRLRQEFPELAAQFD
jgi:thioredoxin-like negative regulator of GroEL